MNNEKPWADEPTPLFEENAKLVLAHRGEIIRFAPPEFARDLERRLRHANALIGKLRADTDCGDFDNDDLAQRLANIEETLTP